MDKISALEYAPSATIIPSNVTPSRTDATYTLAPIATFGPNPVITVCSYCKQNVTTRVKTEISAKTHLMAALLCLFACCCIPYFLDTFKDRNHYCPSCHAHIGVYIN